MLLRKYNPRMGGSSSISIGSNISSLRAQRELSRSTDALSSVYTRLSSGQRINSASDDPAGLAVSTSLRADARIYNQARRNLNDAVSLMNVADGAIEGLSQIVTRIQELAEESANGTLGSKQRESLDAEAQALKQEYTRIAKTTTFNGLSLFDGTLKGVTMQAGYGSNFISASLGGTVADGGFDTANPTASMPGRGVNATVTLGDINGDGKLDIVTATAGGGEGWIMTSLGNGDGTFSTGRSYPTGANRVLLDDVNGDGKLDMVSSSAYATTSTSYLTVRLNSGNGTFGAEVTCQVEDGTNGLAVADFNGDGNLDIATSGGGYGGDSHYSIILGHGDGTFDSPVCYLAVPNATIAALDVGDVNGDGIVDLVNAGVGSIGVFLGHGDGTFAGGQSYEAAIRMYDMKLSDLNGDNVLDFVGCGTSGLGPGLIVKLGLGDGTFGQNVIYQQEPPRQEWIGNNGVAGSLTVSDINADGIKDVITVGCSQEDGVYRQQMKVRLGNGDGSFGDVKSYDFGPGGVAGVAMGDANGDKIGDLFLSYNSVGSFTSCMLGTASAYITPIGPISLKTQSSSLEALTSMKTVLDDLSAQRGQIGALQSRFASAISTLGSTVAEYTAAAGRISDADIGAESAALVRQQILQQAGAAVLSQANQAPALALKLLG